MSNIERHTQQSVAPEVGEHKALRSCAPTCFYMVGRAEGYLQEGSGSDLNSFIDSLDWSTNFSEERGWIRPQLAADLRNQYDMSIVSWRTGGNESADNDTIEKMRSVGYVSSDREVQFYRDHIVGKDPLEVVAEGTPVIAGVLPGFGQNKRAHAVILESVQEGQVKVIDPDERNSEHTYSKEYVQQNLNPTGGGFTVVLPKES